jgi:hypothetical protein
VTGHEVDEIFEPAANAARSLRVIARKLAADGGMRAGLRCV